jgi:type IV pilus assembly protein PilQ
VTNPPRIAIDLPDTSNAMGRSQVDAGEGDLKSISVVQTANRTRLVLNLTRNLSYTQGVEGRRSSSRSTAGKPPRVARPPRRRPRRRRASPSRPGRHHALQPARRRFPPRHAGEGRVVVDLSSPNVGIDIRLQGRQVLVDFINTNVPKNLVRRLDVGDFATPVKFVDTFEQGPNARMVIDPRGLWEYSAYQTDTQFIVEVKPVKEDPNKLVQSSVPGYAGEKLSLNFQNVEVRAVLQVIADFTGLNIITSDTVGGNLTLRLKDVPWDQALDIILQAKGCRSARTATWCSSRPRMSSPRRRSSRSRRRPRSPTWSRCAPSPSRSRTPAPRTSASSSRTRTRRSSRSAAPPPWTSAPTRSSSRTRAGASRKRGASSSSSTCRCARC